MNDHYLQGIFHARSIAVAGASERQGSVGQVVLRNLIEGGFSGPLFGVNPKYDSVQGLPCYKEVHDIPEPVDLVIVAAPARAVPSILESAGRHRTRAAIVLSAGFSEIGDEGARREREMLEVASRHGIRIVGPNCIGVMRPSIGMNATFSHQAALPGNLALLSQSGAVCTALLDWAPPHGVGFSAVVSLGIAADVGFGDMLDFFALDRETDAILLYVEGIRDAARFMGGLRAAARLKPVVVVKAGRHAAGAKAAASHTGALVGGDDAFDAALRRAGAVRVLELDQLFSVASILSSDRDVRGDGLAIVTNAGGPGVLAADRAIDVGLRLPDLGDAAMETLNAALPPQWSHSNPVDVMGDADPGRYSTAVKAVLEDNAIDGLLVMFTPQAITKPLPVAQSITELAPSTRKPLLTCWLGEANVGEARDLLKSAGIPEFDTPEAAVEAFAALASYHRNQQLLLQTPGPSEERPEPDVEGARMIIDAVLRSGRTLLTGMESRAVLRAFAVPVLPAAVARDKDEAMVVAQAMGFPVAMKIHSPDITHKTDVGGVRLGIKDGREVRQAFTRMVAHVAEVQPSARIEGVTIEPMHGRSDGRELLVGAVRDPAFGPVVAFGSGGTLVEILKDRAVALPPLNRAVAADLIDQTRASRLLGELRGKPPVDRAAVEDVLLAVSTLVCELPEVVELDINPLIADADGAVAIDARMVVEAVPPGTRRWSHLAIQPYPRHLAIETSLADGTPILIRPIRPEDAQQEREFVKKLSPRSRTFRFRSAIRELTPQMLARFTQIDYAREMALVAVKAESGEQVGVARYMIDPNRTSCEFAIVVADELQGQGLGSRLLGRLIEVARMQGLETMYGEVQRDNQPMLDLMRFLDFEITPDPEDRTIVRATLTLGDGRPAYGG